MHVRPTISVSSAFNPLSVTSLCMYCMEVIWRWLHHACLHLDSNPSTLTERNIIADTGLVTC
jgi:hypothetical protein